MVVQSLPSLLSSSVSMADPSRSQFGPLLPEAATSRSDVHFREDLGGTIYGRVDDHCREGSIPVRSGDEERTNASAATTVRQVASEPWQ